MRLGFLYGGSLHSACAEELRMLTEYISKRGANPWCYKILINGSGTSTQGYYVQQRRPGKWTLDPVELRKYLKTFKFDAGAQVLPNDVLSQCKSHVKWLEWTMLGVPFVGPDIGQYAEAIEHGKNGLLYRTHGDFYNCLWELHSNAKLRKTLAENAYKSVMENYTMEKVFSKIPECQNARKIILYGYEEPWRVYETERYFKSRGVQTLITSNRQECTDFVDKDTLFYMPRQQLSELEFVENTAKKAGFVLADIDDIFWVEGSYYYHRDWACWLNQVHRIADKVAVSTKMLKPLVEEKVWRKIPVVIRENAINPERYEK